MKKLFSLLALVIVLSLPAYAQFDSGYPQTIRGNWGLEIRVEAQLDSTSGSTTAPDSLATGWIDISDFDSPLDYAQLYWDLGLNGDQTSNSDTSAVLLDVWGNEANSWTGAVNIIQLVDTATYVSTTTLAPSYTASVLSNKRPRYINLVFENQSLTGDLHGIDDSVDVSFIFRLPIKDPKVTDE